MFLINNRIDAKTAKSLSPCCYHFQDSSHSPVIPKFDIDPDVPLETMVTLTGQSASESDDGRAGTGLLIGSDLLGTDPMTQEEMQRKKEKIMMQSLRRKQQVRFFLQT